MPIDLPAEYEIPDGVERTSVEEERELGNRAQAGDQDAINELVRRNVKLSVWWVKQLKLRNGDLAGLEDSDAVQVANLALMEAARRFSPDRGVRFGSYARYWIRTRLQDALDAAKHQVSGPKSYKGWEANRLRKLQREADEHLTPKDLAEITGQSPKRIRGLLRLANAEMESLQDTGGGDRTCQREQLIAGSTQADHESSITAQRALERAKSLVSEREWRILKLYMPNDDVSLRDIGRELGISRERVRQLKDRALDKIRSELDNPI